MKSEFTRAIEAAVRQSLRTQTPRHWSRYSRSEVRSALLALRDHVTPAEWRKRYHN